MGKFWRGLLPLVAVFGAGAASAAAAPLTSHRAIYDISLGHASPKSSVAQVSGRLVIEWLDTCDGFTTNQRMYTRLDNADGGEVASDLWLSSWESRDGQTFRFSMTTRTNGKIDEASRGTAKRGAAGAKGLVEFDVPRAEVRELPSATLFPTSQMVALLQAARAGKRLISQVVFDGSAEEGLNDVSTFIGPKSTKAAACPPYAERASSRAARPGPCAWHSSIPRAPTIFPIMSLPIACSRTAFRASFNSTTASSSSKAR